MRGISIRFATIDDIEVVRVIEREAGQRFLSTEFARHASDEPDDAFTLKARIDAGELIVACESSSPIAFVMFCVIGADVYVEEIDVLPSHAGRRIGAALLDRVACLGRERGLKALILSTFRDVPFNGPYYQRIGFYGLEDAELSPALLAIRAEHSQKGLDETQRVFMRRKIIDGQDQC